MVIAVCGLALPSRAQVREISLGDAVRQALEHSPELQMARIDEAVAGDERWAALASMGPRLSLDANVQFWDKPTAIEFVDPSSIPDPDELGPLKDLLPESFLNLFQELGQPVQVMDRVTGSVTLQALQPLTPLYSLAHLYRMQGFSEEAARASHAAKRSQITFRTAETFFKLMSALRMAEVTNQAVEQVQAHLDTARKFQNAGYVGRDDVLRAETALARVGNLRDQVMSGIALARSALNVHMGLPIDTALLPVGNYPDPPPVLGMTEDQVVAHAFQERPEIRSVSLKADMASSGYQAAVGTLIPTIAAMFRYTHSEGSKFQRDDSWFVGGALQWTFWEWGSKMLKVRAVGRDRRKARLALDMTRDLIRLDIRKSWLDLQQARSSMESHRAAIISAEENLRVVNKKYEVSTATSVEVLDAQGSLTQAKGNYSVSVFDYYIAWANLQRASGGAF